MSDEAVLSLDRSSRLTRGKRMTKLLDDETEADEEFWGQDAFKEDAEDIEYEAEEEDADIFDSDFDEDETNIDDEAPEEDEGRFRVIKKKMFPPGRKPSKDKMKSSTLKTKGIAVIEAAVAAAMDSDDSKPTSKPAKQSEEPNDSHEVSVDLESERIVRKSTRTAVVVRQAERDALRAAMQASIKPVKKKREGEERRITQEDMLLEAAQTEILNRQNLEKMLAHEEEVKQKAIVHKTVYNGPLIRFYSRDGKNFLEFMGSAEKSEELFGQAKPCLRKAQVCVVTGLPAKYVDPLTGLPYGTKEAFKVIREKVHQEEDYSQRNTSKSPWKRARSGRPTSGHAAVTKARRYKLNAASFGYPHEIQSGMEKRPFQVDGKEEFVMPHLPGESPLPGQLPLQEANSKMITHVVDMSPSQALLSAHPISEERSVGPVVDRPTPQVEGLYSLGNHPSPTESKESLASQLQNLKMPLWVEIPPPREEPSQDEYMLDDLTSLDFGPILSLQHGVTRQDLRELELNLENPLSSETLPLDVLPMPNLGVSELL